MDTLYAKLYDIIGAALSKAADFDFRKYIIYAKLI